jgi:dTDP-4-amino-4,6-dideoxygalactose transaminase
MNKLALLGGSRVVNSEADDMFNWPIVNQAMENGIVQVLRDGNMSGTDITKKFEQAYAEWIGAKYALAHNSGTAALQCAMYGIGIGVGDEIICPSITYWASCTQALTLGASVVFADIDPNTLCIDPDDIERHITPRTKAIMVVHYLSMPADMDRIMAIAKKHNLKIIEDVSHAHGALYKGQMVGTFGDAAGYSLMSGKSFAIGEGGMLTTNSKEVYERVIIFAHYERDGEVTDEKLKAGAGLPWGGYKYRMHQMSSVVGLEQVKKYPGEMAEIDQAMNYFWDLLEDVPGLGSHRPSKDSGTTKGGWYASHGIYKKNELGGLSLQRFCDAVQAEGVSVCYPGCNAALHTHPLFSSVDVYGSGMATNRAGYSGELPVAESIQSRVFNIPWFKHYRPEIIAEYAAAYRKVAENYRDLLPGDTQPDELKGKWALTARKS